MHHRALERFITFLHLWIITNRLVSGLFRLSLSRCPSIGSCHVASRALGSNMRLCTHAKWHTRRDIAAPPSPCLAHCVTRSGRHLTGTDDILPGLATFTGTRRSHRYGVEAHQNRPASHQKRAVCSANSGGDREGRPSVHTDTPSTERRWSGVGLSQPDGGGGGGGAMDLGLEVCSHVSDSDRHGSATPALQCEMADRIGPVDRPVRGAGGERR